MSTLTTIFAVLLALILGLVVLLSGFAIIYFLGAGQEYRQTLMVMLKKLPIKRMLEKRGINIDNYLQEQSALDVREQIRNCNNCTTKEECEDNLSKEATPETDYSFCPNDETFKRIKSSGSDIKP